MAAIGWFDLGNYVEAFNELENLPPEHRASFEVMELRCRIYRKLERWRELEMVAEGCLASAEDVTRIPFACHHAWALLKQGRAWEARAALDKVPYTCAPELLFTGACVSCATGEYATEEIEGWVHHSVDTKKPVGKAVRTTLDHVMNLRSVLGTTGDKWVGGGASTGDLFTPPDRELTPRSPYLASPLSFLSFGGPWTYDLSRDILSWGWSNSPSEVPTPIRFYFSNVAPSRQVLLSLIILARSSDSNNSGSFGIRKAGAGLYNFKATGLHFHTVDFTVYQAGAGDITVLLEGGINLEFFQFRRVQFRYL